MQEKKKKKKKSKNKEEDEPTKKMTLQRKKKGKRIKKKNRTSSIIMFGFNKEPAYVDDSFVIEIKKVKEIIRGRILSHKSCSKKEPL